MGRLTTAGRTPADAAGLNDKAIMTGGAAAAAAGATGSNGPAERNGTVTVANENGSVVVAGERTGTV